MLSGLQCTAPACKGLEGTLKPVQTVNFPLCANTSQMLCCRRRWTPKAALLQSRAGYERGLYMTVPVQLQATGDL